MTVVDSDDGGGNWARGSATAPAPATSAPAGTFPAAAAAAAAAAVDCGYDSDDSETWLDAPVGYAHYDTAAVADELGWAGGPLLPPLAASGSARVAGDKRPRGTSTAAPSRSRGAGGGGDARFADGDD